MIKHLLTFFVAGFIISGAVIAKKGSSIKSISSPGYPQNYPHNAVKSWNISVEEGEKLKLTFKTFDVEASQDSCWDWLEIHYSSNSSKLCGQEIPNPIISDTNTMYLKFRSDETGSREGFLAEYFAVDSDTEPSDPSPPQARPVSSLTLEVTENTDQRALVRCSWQGEGTADWDISPSTSVSGITSVLRIIIAENQYFSPNPKHLKSLSFPILEGFKDVRVENLFFKTN